MIKTAITVGFLFCFIINVKAQFNTIYNTNLTKEEPQTVNNAPPAKQPEAEKSRKNLFSKIMNLFSKDKKDTIPANPALLSYDKPEGDGMFIFTEKQEKAYLDSLKMKLIEKRHSVIKKRSMMSLPLDTLQITSHFGYRKDPFSGERKFHSGIDFRAKNNFVYPVLPGVVVRAGFRNGYGFCIEVRHGELTTLYAHLSYILVKEKQIVPAGEPIGISGTTGRSTGEHLHFSLLRQGQFIDPSPMLEYILGELTDRNFAKEQLELKKKESNRNKEKEKHILETLQATEPSQADTTKRLSPSVLILGGPNGIRKPLSYPSKGQIRKPAEKKALLSQPGNIQVKGKTGVIIKHVTNVKLKKDTLSTTIQKKSNSIYSQTN